MRLVDVEPIIEAWKKSGNSKKAEAKALMNSGIYSEEERKAMLVWLFINVCLVACTAVVMGWK